jgi:hypothetical protein
MRDSPTDQPTIMEVLAACVRGHAPIVPDPADATGNQEGDASSASESAYRSPPEDVLAVLTVLGRRQAVAGEKLIDLRSTNLAGANLARATLAGANLSQTNLTQATLAEANLTQANLTQANLTGANLYEARLNGAHLTGADLTGADLTGADLTQADFEGANLRDAYLFKADLREVNRLSQEQIDGAVVDQETMLPPGLVRPTAKPST